MIIPSVPSIEALPAERNPAIIYLASLTAGEGRRSMASTLSQLATMLGCRDAASCPWHELRHPHVAALRTVLAERYAPATANKALAAIRGVLRAAWRLELIPTEAYHRAVDVPLVRGARLPAGRSLEASEIQALFSACADGTPAGARDAAAFALLFGCGLRRAEAVAVRIVHYDMKTGAIRVIGKGNRERFVYATGGTKAALDAWLAHRGVVVAGPILAPVSHTGVIDIGRGITPNSLMMRLRKRCREAGVAACSPHDLRRSFVSAALEAGADLAMVQALAGHASPTTTARYDRRPETAKAAAARLVHVPFAPV
ncbi:MAG: tyrosine-type recombinase/integrase [Rhodospirillaceae bacterium]|nr:tyrosine-type recombinase/integrase [Rhodospirillaceae bacterium]